MPPVISPTSQDFLKTAAGIPTQYAPGLTPLAPPNPTVLDASTVAGGGGTAGGAAAPDPNAAYWAAQNGLVDDQLNRLGTQSSIGHSNILDAYNAAFQTLTNNKATAERDYGTARDNTNQDNVRAKAGIDDSVRTQLTGAQRLLGSRGAGNSSLSQVFAPYAAGRTGDIQRGQVQNAYGRNISSIDTALNDTLAQFANAFGQLTTDRTNKDRALDSGIATTRAGLLGQKQLINAKTGQPMDPTVNQQIKDLGAQVDQYGRTETFTPQAVNAAKPDLASYDYTKFNTPTIDSGVDPALAGNLGAFWTLLNGGDKKKANSVGV